MEMQPSPRTGGFGVEGDGLSQPKALESCRALGAALGRGIFPSSHLLPAARGPVLQLGNNGPDPSHSTAGDTQAACVPQGNNEFQLAFSSAVGSGKQGFLV